MLETCELQMLGLKEKGATAQQFGLAEDYADAQRKKTTTLRRLGKKSRASGGGDFELDGFSFAFIYVRR